MSIRRIPSWLKTLMYYATYCKHTFSRNEFSEFNDQKTFRSFRTFGGRRSITDTLWFFRHVTWYTVTILRKRFHFVLDSFTTIRHWSYNDYLLTFYVTRQLLNTRLYRGSKYEIGSKKERTLKTTNKKV